MQIKKQIYIKKNYNNMYTLFFLKFKLQNKLNIWSDRMLILK